MRKFVLLLAVAVFVWKYESSTVHTGNQYPVEQKHQTINTPAPKPAVQPRFRCDGREYCSQMRSRAEAEFFNKHCPGTKMDGDRDGIPCENDSRW